jgi:hypothetical protein
MISDPHDLAQRVEKLEKANRRLKLAGVLALTLVGCLLLLGVASPKRTVSAQEFILRDANGKVQAVLGMRENDPMLGFSDANGKVRLMLTLSEGMPGLGFLDANGKARALLGVSAVGPKLVFRDANGQTRAALGMSAEGPKLVFRDANGKLVFSAPR